MVSVPYPSTETAARDDAGRAVGVSGSQRARAKDFYAEEAKKRQKEQAKRNQPQSQKVANLPPIEKAKARDQAGEAFGVSGRSINSKERQAPRSSRLCRMGKDSRKAL